MLQTVHAIAFMLCKGGTCWNHKLICIGRARLFTGCMHKVAAVIEELRAWRGN